MRLSQVVDTRGSLSRIAPWWGLIEWSCLVIITPFLLFAAPARAPFLFVIPALWILRRFVLGQFVPCTPVDIPVLVLLMMGGVGFCVSPNPAWSQMKINALLLGVGFLYATVDLLTPDGRLRWVPAGVIGLSLSFLVLGLLGTEWRPKVSGLAMLVAGLPGEISWLPEGETVFNPNVIGGALLWILPFSLGLFWMAVRASICVEMVERKWGLAVAEGLVAFLSLGLLILTQARGAWLGFGVCLLTLLIAAGGHMRRIGVALFLVAVFTLILVGPMGLDQAIGVDRGGSRILSTVSMEQRFEIWSRAQYAIADFPFTGCGMDVFQHLMPVMYPLLRVSSDGFIPHAHNEFLQVALDLGLPGLVAWGALYSIAFWMLWQAYRRSSNDLNRVLSLGGGGALAGHLAYAMTDSAVLDAKPNIVFWVIVGLTVVLHQAVGQEEAT